jgi:hypothetical protein
VELTKEHGRPIDAHEIEVSKRSAVEDANGSANTGGVASTEAEKLAFGSMGARVGEGPSRCATFE